MRFKKERKSIVKTMRKLNDLKLNKGSSGNISLRISLNEFLITSSGVSADLIQEENIVEMNLDGTFDSLEKPSSEWQIHRNLYRSRFDVNAIVHTHSVNAATLSCLRKHLPAFHYMVAVAGGRDIRCCDYELFGSSRLAEKVESAMLNRWACLVANHGLVSCGESLDFATYLAEEVESLCGQYLQALTIGGVHLLNDNQMDEVIEKFRSYGFNKKAKINEQNTSF
ncbi:MAG: hypothetical protein CBC42_05830 [Betaproteobacteria bacterium TMED82]|nr:MAG: hypothetical protein CBC42_05830 [Betaproteobacteria bacterium TMED82]